MGTPMTFWRRYDRVPEALHRRGITAHILIKVYNKMVRWPNNNSFEEDCYVHWLLNPTLVAVLLSVLSFSGTLTHAQTSLRQHGSATQLLVDGKPFLMLGVETTNKLLDDPSDLPYLDENLAMYKAAGVNTVLIPITWKSLEPVEDEYDYTMIDALIVFGHLSCSDVALVVCMIYLDGRD